jgi:hypothetical protein
MRTWSNKERNKLTFFIANETIAKNDFLELSFKNSSVTK